jgi:tetratricopeptide (TPR) repeat protein
MRLLGIGPVGTLVASGRLSERDQLIVADFENRTQDAGLGASVTEAFRIDLGQSPVVRILSASAMSDALNRMQLDPGTPLTARLARDVAVREGAKAVVTGDISPVGRGYALSARIVDAKDGSELVALRETADDDRGIVAAIDRLSTRVRERIGESLRTIRAGEPLDKVTTGSLEALRLYSEASRLSDMGNADSAIPLLKEAIALDTGFAMAWRKLAVALGNSEASEEQAAAAATKAYEYRDRLPEIERQLAMAYYFGTVDWQPDKHEGAYRRILEIDPENYIALNNLALHLTNYGRHVEAESLAAVGVRLERRPGNPFYQLINAQLGQGRFDAARESLEELGRLDPTSTTYLRAKAWVLTASGAYDSAQRAWLDLGLKARDPSWQSVSNFGLATVAQVQGRLAEAERQLRLNTAVSESRGLPGAALETEARIARQYALFRADTAGALRALQSASAKHPLSSIPALDRPYAALATAYSVAGQPALARRILEEYEATVPIGRRRGQGEWYRATGWLALAEGRPQDAVTAFRTADQSGDCPDCTNWELGIAFDRSNQTDSALAAYQRAVSKEGTGWKTFQGQWGLAASLKRLGEMYDARGDRQKAIDYYSRFVDLWREADPVLQPAVRQARDRLTILAGEGK